MPAGPPPPPFPRVPSASTQRPDGALLAQPPLPAAPSQGGHQAKEELGALGARGHHGEGEEVSTCLPVTGVPVSQS